MHKKINDALSQNLYEKINDALSKKEIVNKPFIEEIHSLISVLNKNKANPFNERLRSLLSELSKIETTDVLARNNLCNALKSFNDMLLGSKTNQEKLVHLNSAIWRLESDHIPRSDVISAFCLNARKEFEKSKNEISPAENASPANLGAGDNALSASRERKKSGSPEELGLIVPPPGLFDSDPNPPAEDLFKTNPKINSPPPADPVAKPSETQSFNKMLDSFVSTLEEIKGSNQINYIAKSEINNALLCFEKLKASETDEEKLGNLQTAIWYLTSENLSSFEVIDTFCKNAEAEFHKSKNEISPLENPSRANLGAGAGAGDNALSASPTDSVPESPTRRRMGR